MTETHYLPTKEVPLRKLDMVIKGFVLKSQKDYKNGRSQLVFIEEKKAKELKV